MSKKKAKPNEKMQAWIDARQRHHLSHAQVQMARELGMNPKHFGKIDNHRQEPWEMPLRHFIEYLYEKRFGKERPDAVLTIEEVVRYDAEKKERKREAKLQRRLNTPNEQGLAVPEPSLASGAAKEDVGQSGNVRQSEGGITGAEECHS